MRNGHASTKVLAHMTFPSAKLPHSQLAPSHPSMQRTPPAFSFLGEGGAGVTFSLQRKPRSSTQEKVRSTKY